MPKVICIGSVAKDIFFPTGEGVILETPEDVTSQRKIAFELGAKYQIEDRFEALGGVAANVSVSLSRLGIEASCYGAIGDDEIGRWIRESLIREGVKTTLLEELSQVKSDLSAILVFTDSGERTIFYNRDAAEGLLVSEERLGDADWIFTSALNGKWEENLRVAMASADTLRMKFAYNPGQRNLKDNPKLVREAVSRADFLALNKDEAIEIILHSTDHSSESVSDYEAELLRKLHSFGARMIVLTDGVRGAWGSDGQDIFRIYRHKPESALDTTGAGDAFGSAFLAAILQHLPLEEALRWGALNAGNVVRHYGAIEGLLSYSEIRKETDEFVIEQVKK